VAGCTDSGEARLQPVAKRHQLIDLGDDTMLFGERRKKDLRRLNLLGRDVRYAVASTRINLLGEVRRIYPNADSTRQCIEI